MTAVTYKGAMSKGSVETPTAPPTPLTKKIQCSKSYVGGKLIGVVGDQFEDHTNIVGTLHQDALRQITLVLQKHTLKVISLQELMIQSLTAIKLQTEMQRLS